MVVLKGEMTMKKDKYFIIVYEMCTTDDGQNDERPIFNCDNINEVVERFDRLFNIKASKRAIYKQAKNEGVFCNKFKIFRFKI